MCINFLFQVIDDKVDSRVKALAASAESRQDLYMALLKKRGQMIQTFDGGWKLVSYAELPLRMPRTLKAKNLTEWPDRDKVWLNM